MKDERLCSLPTVMPVATLWGQGDKVGESIPTATNYSPVSNAVSKNSRHIACLCLLVSYRPLAQTINRLLESDGLAHDARRRLGRFPSTSEPVADRDLRAGSEVHEVLAEEDVVFALWGGEERIAIS